MAEKYSNDRENLNYLSSKIIEGGAGIWGGAVMSGHPFLKKEETLRMAKWILEVKNQAAAVDTYWVFTHWSSN